jgi:hypothetical protein
MSSAKGVLVSEVTYWSLPLLYFFSYVRPVYYWRPGKLSPRSLRRFTQVVAEDSFTIEEWCLAEEDALVCWGKIRAELGPRIPSVGIAQRIALLFRNEALSSLIARRLDLTFLPRYLWISPSKAPEYFSPSVLGSLHLCLDGFGSSAFRALRGAKAMVGWLSLPMASRQISVDILWTGVSPSETPKREGDVDFAFLAPYLADQGIDPHRILYVTDFALDQESRAYLNSRSVRAFSTHEIKSLVPRFARLRALLSWVLLALRPGNLWAWRLERGADVLAWTEIKKCTGFRLWVNSLTLSSPEPWETESLAENGVRTLLWYYAASDWPFFLRPKACSRFTNLLFDGFNPVVQDIVVWNAEQANALRERSKAASSSSAVYHTISPLMACDTASAQRATGNLQNRFYLTVFDWPRATRALAALAGVGPNRLTLQNMESYYRDIQRLLDEVPELIVRLKPKRSFEDARREYPAALKELLARKDGRVEVYSGVINFYTPILQADACLGLPFTSPIFAARDLGVQGFFYAPQEMSAGSSLMPELDRTVTRGYESLLAEVKRGVEQKSRGMAKAGPLPRRPEVQFAKLIRSMLG